MFGIVIVVRNVIVVFVFCRGIGNVVFEVHYLALLGDCVFCLALVVRSELCCVFVFVFFVFSICCIVKSPSLRRFHR